MEYQVHNEKKYLISPFFHELLSSCSSNREITRVTSTYTVTTGLYTNMDRKGTIFSQKIQHFFPIAIEWLKKDP